MQPGHRRAVGSGMPEVPAPHESIDRDTHRRVAVDLFNHVWTLLRAPERSRAEEDAMIHAAHASRHHWGVVGDSKNWAIGEWQISRVYATLGRAEPALYHGGRCLEICGEHQLTDFILAYAHEALARAYALTGDAKERDHHLAAARGTEIAEAETRARLEEDLAGI